MLNEMRKKIDRSLADSMKQIKKDYKLLPFREVLVEVGWHERNRLLCQCCHLILGNAAKHGLVRFDLDVVVRAHPLRRGLS